MRRGATLVVSTMIMAGCTASPVSAPPSVTATPTRVEPTGSPVPGGCGTTALRTGALPSWTADAGVPAGPATLASHESNLVGVVFGYPLTAPPVASGAQNKILWIVKEPRNGSDLVLTLRPDSGAEPVTLREPPNSSPGEIYPSIVDVPTPGCWNVVAEWAGHRATFELFYEARGS